MAAGLQWLGIGEEPVHPHRPPVGLRGHEVDLLETGGVEPRADRRRQVRGAPMAGPDDFGTRGTELGDSPDRRANVVVTDVAEDPAQENEIGGHRARIHIASRGVGLPHLDISAQGRPRLSSAICEPGVVLDKKCFHTAGVGPLCEHAQEVATVTRAGADHAHSVGSGPVQIAVYLGADLRETVGQPGLWPRVRVVPPHPVCMPHAPDGSQDLAFNPAGSADQSSS